MSVKPRLSAVGLGVALALYGSSAFAAGTVEVSLWDNPAMTMTMTMGPRMGGDRTMAAMGITGTTAGLTAGEVTFNVTNTSTLFQHEMVVVPLAAVDAIPPYDATGMRVDEAAAGALGEVPELLPGATGSVTLNLPAGIYMLICNIPGHYAAGMWLVITVTP